MPKIRQKPVRSIGDDPYLSFRFRVEIDSLERAGFHEVTGLTFETDVQTFREGGGNLCERQLPGATKCPSKLVLKRGLADAELWSWYQDVMYGLIKRQDVTILLLDPASDEERWRWLFLDACPVKWTGPNFRAGSAEVAFETVEVIHKGLLYTYTQAHQR